MQPHVTYKLVEYRNLCISFFSQQLESIMHKLKKNFQKIAFIFFHALSTQERTIQPPHSWEQFLQVFVILGQCSFCGLLELLFDLLLPVGVHDHLWGEKSRHGDELQVGVSNQLAGQPEERLLKVVIALSTNVVVLK